MWDTSGMASRIVGRLVKQRLGMAEDLVLLASRRPAPERPAKEFKRLVKKRNDVLHGKPGTAKNGDQRLFNAGQELKIADLEAIGDEFAVGSHQLNALLYGVLKKTLGKGLNTSAQCHPPT
jgi:hypothetical protein